MNDIKWTYKGYKCHIEIEADGETRKAFHWITQPNGVAHCAPISPYDHTQTTVELYIEYGCPVHPTGGNWDRIELETYMEAESVRRAKNLARFGYA